MAGFGGTKSWILTLCVEFRICFGVSRTSPLPSPSPSPSPPLPPPFFPFFSSGKRNPDPELVDFELTRPIPDPEYVVTARKFLVTGIRNIRNLAGEPYGQVTNLRVET